MVCSANITVKQQSRVLTEFLIFVCTRHAKIYHVVTFYSRHATANKIKKIRAFASCFTSYCECRISTFLTKKTSQEKIFPSPYSKGTKRDATATTEALRKSSFKDLQELLVLLYIRYVVFGEGFGLLRPFFKFKKFAWQHCPPLDLDYIDEAGCKAEFRVKKQHLPCLVEVLQLPSTFTCRQRSVYEGVEGFRMLLRRACFPCWYSDMIDALLRRACFPCCDMIPR